MTIHCKIEKPQTKEPSKQKNRTGSPFAALNKKRGESSSLSTGDSSSLSTGAQLTFELADMALNFGANTKAILSPKEIYKNALLNFLQAIK